MRVTKVVKPNPAHSCEPDPPLEVVAEERGVDRISALGAEDQAVIVEGRCVRFDRHTMLR
jgi:hypothetical protein